MLGIVDILRLQCVVGAGIYKGGIFTFGVNQSYNDACIFGFCGANKIGVNIELSQACLDNLCERVSADLAYKIYLTAAQSSFESVKGKLARRWATPSRSMALSRLPEVTGQCWS